MPLRLIFMGTPDFAVPTLLELVAVYTRAPKPARRVMKKFTRATKRAREWGPRRAVTPRERKLIAGGTEAPSCAP